MGEVVLRYSEQGSKWQVDGIKFQAAWMGWHVDDYHLARSGASAPIAAVDTDDGHRLAWPALMLML